MVCYYTFLLTLLPVVFASCRNDIEKIDFFGRKDMPLQTIDTARIVRSSEGRLQIVMTAPRIEQYSTPERRTVYPQGFTLHCYDNARKPSFLIKAKYGVQLDDKQTMEARGDVVIIDYNSGDTTYLDHIIWDQNDQRIFSDAPIRSVNGQRVTIGDGFESDDQFIHPQILHQRGTVVINEEEEID